MKAGTLINSAAIGARIQRFKLVSPNTYSIHELLGNMESMLQNQIQEQVIGTKDKHLKP